jgi:hypothetical protein
MFFMIKQYSLQRVHKKLLTDIKMSFKLFMNNINVFFNTNSFERFISNVSYLITLML